MKEKYLVPIKDAFLVYQPEQDVVYKGPRKTIGIWRSMRLAGISSAIFPFFSFVANHIWPSTNLFGYKIIMYTFLMFIFGFIYYKYAHIKYEEKLLQSQLEKMYLIDIKEEVLKDCIKALIVWPLFILFLLFASIYVMLNMGVFDNGMYIIAVIMYTIGIPLLIIGAEFKGRFLLVKHLLKLNN